MENFPPGPAHSIGAEEHDSVSRRERREIFGRMSEWEWKRYAQIGVELARGAAAGAAAMAPRPVERTASMADGNGQSVIESPAAGPPVEPSAAGAPRTLPLRTPSPRTPGMSGRRRKCVAVQCVSDGKTFASATEAAVHAGCHPQYMQKSLRTGNGSALIRGKTFRIAGEEPAARPKPGPKPAIAKGSPPPVAVAGEKLGAEGSLGGSLTPLETVRLVRLTADAAAPEADLVRLLEWATDARRNEALLAAVLAGRVKAGVSGGRVVFETVDAEAVDSTEAT